MSDILLGESERFFMRVPRSLCFLATRVERYPFLLSSTGIHKSPCKLVSGHKLLPVLEPTCTEVAESTLTASLATVTIHSTAHR